VICLSFCFVDISSKFTMASVATAELPISNLTGYRFVDLPDRDELRQPLRDACIARGLKGLILLSHEGLNYFVAGTPEGTSSFKRFLNEQEGCDGTGTSSFDNAASDGTSSSSSSSSLSAHSSSSSVPPPPPSVLSGRFVDIPSKESFSATAPFKRMLVKLKGEIISLGVDGVKPATRTGKRLEPEVLKQWLDEGKPCVLLDTRNDYEIRIGAFDNAVDLEMDSFKEFPAHVNNDHHPKLPARDSSVPVVTYCTGGVRCEKATAVMLEAGFEDVYQLEGGILRYFEKCGGAHWRGDCFVFDDRVALTTQLTPSEGATMCFNCRAPLTLSDQASPLFVYEKSCPYCAEKKSCHQADSRTEGEGGLDQRMAAAVTEDDDDDGGGGGGGGPRKSSSKVKRFHVQKSPALAPSPSSPLSSSSSSSAEAPDVKKTKLDSD